ncbi:MAG: hypothetical protein WBA51_20090, partial [Erythrobacter sp.]
SPFARPSSANLHLLAEITGAEGVQSTISSLAPLQAEFFNRIGVSNQNAKCRQLGRKAVAADTVSFVVLLATFGLVST